MRGRRYPLPGGKVRTLSWISRAFAVAAAIAAAVMIVGGSYFVGFVSEVQRGLNDPESSNRQAAERISSIEQILGYNGYLKAYRTFRLTGDVAAREQMTKKSMDAARSLDLLRKLYTETPAATRTIQDLSSVVEEFAHVARIAPDMGPAALRGSSSMDALETLPQLPQLEATYLTLRTALERLRSQTQSHQMGSIAWALSWSQMLIICSLAALVCGLLGTAGLLQLGITQPLKSLEQSLTAIGDGRVDQPIWGTDRPDEIGTMARAGEKLRKSLTETESLKTLAEKGEVHIKLEGDSSILLEKLAAGVTAAADALKNATTEITEAQSAHKLQFENSLSELDKVGPRLDNVATAIDRAAREQISGVASTLHHSLTKLVDLASERTERLNQITVQFEQSGKHLSDAVDLVKGKTGTAIDGLTNSITSFKKAADGAEGIQGAFFAACDRISSDAAATNENIKGLSDKLGSVVDSVDTKLQRKIHALDRLEVGIETTLGSMERRAKETSEAIAAASAAMEQRTARVEDRTSQSISEFEQIVNLFKDEHAQTPDTVTRDAFQSAVEQLNNLATRLQEHLEKSASTGPRVEALTNALARKIELSINALSAQNDKSTASLSTAVNAIDERTAQAEKQVDRSLGEFRELIELFKTGRMSQSQPAAVQPDPSNFALLVQPLSAQIETLRNDVRGLAMRMTEERIMMTAEMPATAMPNEVKLKPSQPQRSLSEVPVHEILARLQNLAEEMSQSASANTIEPANLADALCAFADSMQGLSSSPAPFEQLKAIAPELTRHANNIEASATNVSPSAVALRTELDAITAEVRAMAVRLQAADTENAQVLTETALHLGARAETLFSYLNAAHADGFVEPGSPAPAPATFEQTAGDLDTLVRIIGKLEERASRLSDAAVAANLDMQTASASPTEQGKKQPADTRRNDLAITAVYESIERLNNIAAALARANDANQQHRAAI